MNGLHADDWLRTDPGELLVIRRRLSLEAEWLYDRGRLFSLAAHTPGRLHMADLAIAVDEKLRLHQALDLLDGELYQAGLVDRDDSWWKFEGSR